MIRGRGQDLTSSIPSAFDHKPRLDEPGQPRRLLVDDTVAAEHMRHHLAGRRLNNPHRRRAAHLLTPACSRGLGTASTAARSLPGSGCTYTADEDTEA